MNKLYVYTMVLLCSLCLTSCANQDGHNDIIYDTVPEETVVIDTMATITNADEIIDVDASESMALTATEIYESASKCTVEITAESQYATSIGSGFFEDSTGTVITNFHVIEGAERICATTYDGTEYEVEKIIGYDKKADIALLETSCVSSSFLSERKEAAITGESVYTLGSSIGLTGTFSDGIVSSSSREIDGCTFIQITAPISPGNSGGPLLDATGLVIGITSAGLSEGQNLNLAIPIAQINEIDRSMNVVIEDFYATTNPYQELIQYLQNNGNTLSFGGAYCTLEVIPSNTLEICYEDTTAIDDLGLNVLSFGYILEFANNQGNACEMYTRIRFQPQTSECSISSDISDSLNLDTLEIPKTYIKTSTNTMPIEALEYGIPFTISETDNSINSEEFILLANQSVSTLLVCADAWFAMNGLSCTTSAFGF